VPGQVARFCLLRGLALKAIRERFSFVRLALLSVLSLFPISILGASDVPLPDQQERAIGYASEVSGGEGGATVVASNKQEFVDAIAREEPLIIKVEGNYEVGSVTFKTPNKTIQGTGSKPTLRGSLWIYPGADNVIVRDLNISNPTSHKKSEGFDGISIRGARGVWVHSCTFTDCGDGSVDVTEGADRVTVSWCKFQYSSKKSKHRFVMLAYGPSRKKDKSCLHLTLHHNWFAKNCDARMPLVQKAKVHMFNNLLEPKSENNFGTAVRERGELLSQRNVYIHVRNPLYSEDGGKIAAHDNKFHDCHGRFPGGRRGVFTPSYSYPLSDVDDVPKVVRKMAGCRL